MVLLLACRPTQKDPNLLLITLDTTRADHLGTYGYFRNTTPRIDALAPDALVFDRCLVPMAVTLPSHTSMMTGVYPTEHGLLANNRGATNQWVRAPLTTLASWLAEGGYRTGGFVSGAPLRAGSGIEEGFQTWSEPPVGTTVRRGDATTDEALGFIGSGKGPFFAWLHLFDAHGGSAPPDSVQFEADDALSRWTRERAFTPTLTRGGDHAVPVERILDRYDAEIRFMDDQIGRIIDHGRRRGWWANTLVVILGDHGEGLGQHGLSAHGHIWEEQLQAPFLLLGPGVAPGRWPEPVSSADLVPTLLGRLALGGEGPLLGQVSGSDLLSGRRDRPVFSMSSAKARRGHPKAVSLAEGSWRYIRESDGSEHLFDLAVDPFELADAVAAEPARIGAMGSLTRQIEDHQAARGRAFGAGGSEALPEQQADELRELGYVE